MWHHGSWRVQESDLTTAKDRKEYGIREEG